MPQISQTVYIYTAYLTVISRILNFRSILILIFHVVYIAFFEENIYIYICILRIVLGRDSVQEAEATVADL